MKQEVAVHSANHWVARVCEDEAGNFCRACSVVAGRATRVVFRSRRPKEVTLLKSFTVETERPTNLSRLLELSGVPDKLEKRGKRIRSNPAFYSQGSETPGRVERKFVPVVTPFNVQIL